MAATPDEISRLCQGCGMCCDGTIFGSVTLGADELGLLSRHSLPVVPDQPAFTQPCPKHEANVGCSIYDERPGACRRFRCGLVKSVEAGTKTVDEQQQRVQRTRELLTRCKARGHEVRAVVESGMAWARGGASGPIDREAAELMLDLSELRIILQRDYGVE